MMRQDTDVKRLSPLSPLEGLQIAFGICGGIAAIEAPQIARQLRRLGAHVKAYMSLDALAFIGKDAIEWATLSPPEIRFRANASHVMQEDALLIAPLTMNVSAQIATGQAPSPLTALAASCMGLQKPLFLLPTMHGSMWDNPAFQKNLHLLSSYKNVTLLPSRYDEDKYKMPSKECVTMGLSHHLNRRQDEERHLLITGGSASSVLDGVRVLSNEATGKTALDLATAACLDGVKVHVLVPKAMSSMTIPSYEDLSPYVNLIGYTDFRDYAFHVHTLLKKYPIRSAIFTAAVSDYSLKTPLPSKTRSQTLSLKLHRHEKIVETIRKAYPALHMVVFKYEVGLSYEDLRAQGEAYLHKGYDRVFLNQKENLQKKALHFLDETSKHPRGYLMTTGTKDVQPIKTNAHLYRTLKEKLFCET